MTEIPITPPPPGSGKLLPLARPRALMVAVVLVGTLLGWLYLGAMVAAMLPMTDMSEFGPGMGLLNAFNQFAGLPPEVRKALAVLCTPTSGHFGMPGAGPWGAWDLAMVFAMWCAMVLAMMLPTAGPMMAAFADRAEAEAMNGGRSASVAVLAGGYLTVWFGFAVVATLAQWGLTAARTLSPAMAPASLILAGSTLIAAGIYQFTPAKYACLARCRTPAAFFSEHWARDARGVFGLGIEQGLFCFGCCWALMAVMFAVGVMNVVWIAVIGLVMAIEKLTTSFWVAWAVGIGLIAWGTALILASPVGARLLAFV
ncbi:MAG: DUF2182 domain-containing protein [Hyphomicrobiaceae bacterium]|nr:DUF2182 domain-containing protein [Hyphomicrobiaceae bacterium]